MMLKLRFHIDWVTLVVRCVAFVSYRMGFNGNLSDLFVPSRGLRQGNPMSIYLFLICAEGFSTLLEQAKV